MLPPLLPCYSLDYLGWQLLEQPFFFYILEGIFYGVEAGTVVVVNTLYYQEEDNGMVYRVVGGARAVNDQAECLEDKIVRADVFWVGKWSDH